MNKTIAICMCLFAGVVYADIEDVSNNNERISYYLDARGEDGSTQRYSMRAKAGRQVEIAEWGYTNAVPVEADLPSSTVASQWADGLDTTARTMQSYTVEQLTLLKILFDVVNDVRSRHGQGALTRAQFEDNVLKPAYQWAKDDAQ